MNRFYRGVCVCAYVMATMFICHKLELYRNS